MDKIDRIIKESIKKALYSNIKNRNTIVEGINYDKNKDSFTFDFSHDSEHDIIKLTNHGLHKSEIYNKCFFFKYQFEDNADTSIRTKFIDYIKFHDNMKDNDVSTFIRQAVNSLDDTINLRNYNTVVYPQSLSEINREMLSYLRMFGYPEFIPFELVKLPPSEMTFDYESYKRDVLNATHQIGNREFPRYTEEQKTEILSHIKAMMNQLNNKDYFSIGKDMKVKYRNYLHNIYKFHNEEEKESFKKITQPNVLIIDDIKTTGASLNFVIDTIYKANPNATMIVFSLIGKD